jgi:hypothetical protein
MALAAVVLTVWEEAAQSRAAFHQALALEEGASA